MGCSSDTKKCDAATKKKAEVFYLLSGKDVHESCNERGNPSEIDGKYLNTYIDILKEIEIDDALELVDDYRSWMYPFR